MRRERPWKRDLKRNNEKKRKRSTIDLHPREREKKTSIKKEAAGGKKD